MNTESGVWQDGSELEATINVWPRGLLMVQLWAQGRGEVTPVIMCQHTASLCHCWPSPGRATLQWDVGRSLWSPFVPAMWRAFHINTSSQRKGLIWILQEEHCQVSVRSQTPSFWLLSPLFGKCSLFNWLFWGQWWFFFFLVINFKNKSAEASRIIFRKELPKEQPLLAKSNCRAHRGQAQPQDHRTFIRARI